MTPPSFEKHNDVRFLVMELVECETLEARIEQGPIPIEKAMFHIHVKTWEKFMAALDAPTKDNPRLCNLMSREPAWKD